MSGVINFLRTAGFVAKIYYIGGEEKEDFELESFEESLLALSTNLDADMTLEDGIDEQVIIIPEDGLYLASGEPKKWKSVISARYVRAAYGPHSWISIDISSVPLIGIVKDVTNVEAFVDKDKDYWFIIIYSVNGFKDTLDLPHTKLVELFDNIELSEAED